MYRTVLWFLASLLTAAELPRLNYSIPIPGSDLDAIAGMATDPAGNIYLAANTKSPDLPTTPNALQPVSRFSGLYRLRTSPEPLTGSGVLSNVLGLAAGELPSVIYAAGARGLVKSTDGGDTWVPCGPFENHSVTAVVTAQSLPSVVYAAGELGILRSVDSGGNWTDVTPPAIASVLSSHVPVPLFVSPADPNVVFAAVDPFAISKRFFSPNLYVTSDGGQAWTALQFRPLGAIAFDSKGALYAIGADRGAGGFYRTTDVGATWQRISSGPDPSVTYALLGGPDVTTLYAGGFTGVFRSTDSGTTWSKLNTGVTVGLAASPDFSALYQITAQTIFRSSNGGMSWAALPLPAPVQTTVLATAGAFFSAALMPNQIYIAKLDAGANVVYGTYYGGGNDSIAGIDVDSAGNAWIVGQVRSATAPKSGPFVAKINADASQVLFSEIRLAYSTTGLSVAGDDSVYLAETFTLPPFEPCQPLQPVCPPTQYASDVVHKLSSGADDWSAKPDLRGDTNLSTAALLIKAAPDGGLAAASNDGYFWHYSAAGKSGASAHIPGFFPHTLAVDAGGNLLAGGEAQSSAAATPGAFQTAPRFMLPNIPSQGSLSYSAPLDGFVTKFAPDLSILWATRYGGESSTTVSAIGADADGNVLIGGNTTAHAIAQRVPLQGFFSPTQTGYLAKLDAQGSQLLWSTYIGDANPSGVNGMAIDSSGNAVVASQTFDSQSAINSPALYAGSDVVLASIGPGDPAPPVTLDGVINMASRGTTALAPGGLFAVQGSGFDATSAVIWFDDEAVTPWQMDDGDIAVQVPDSVAGKRAVAVHVEANGTASNTILMPAAPVAPAVYTADGSGVGQAMIYNEDGSANSAGNPAVRGSVVTLLLNGVTDQPLDVNIIFSTKVLDVQVVDGVTKVKVRVPDTFTTTVLYRLVSVAAGGVRSQGAVYIVIK